MASPCGACTSDAGDLPLKLLRTIMILTIAAYAVTVYADDARSIDPVGELQDAALNYQAAAEAQLAQANGLLQARQTPSDDDEQEIKRRRRSSNASLELQASNHLMGAAGNFDNAARVWRAAAQATRETAAREYFHRAAQDANRRATILVRRAAELAEHAALEYAALQDLGNQVNASHRAGRIREQLSGRR